MSNDSPDRRTAPDSPSRDALEDSDAIPESEEPDPAEVVGEEGNERDRTRPPFQEPLDLFQHDTLDERLAEEEPEAVLRGSPDEEAGGLQAPERGGDDVVTGEADADPDEPAAEDAAVHIRDEG
jgi:hypothetical protein